MRKALLARSGWIFLLAALASSSEAWSSQPDCYATPAEAAAHSGVRGSQGFRIEAQHRDIFSGDRWVSIRSCEHPERPAWLILAAESGLGRLTGPRQVTGSRALVMRGGARVRLIETGPTARIESIALAETSGAVGDRVKLRRIPVNAELAQNNNRAGGSWDRQEEAVIAIVRSRDLAEVVSR